MAQLSSLKKSILDLPYDEGLALVRSIREDRLNKKPRKMLKTGSKPKKLSKVGQKLNETLRGLPPDKLEEVMRMIKEGD